jgi:hypothetical protein
MNEATDKAAVARRLRVLIGERLFGRGPWLPGPKTSWKLWGEIVAMKLVTEDGSRRSISTPLGKYMNVDLMLVFLGLFDPLLAPITLEQNNLMDEDEVDAVYAGVEKPERVLPPYLRRAFKKYFGAPSKLQ